MSGYVELRIKGARGVEFDALNFKMTAYYDPLPFVLNPLKSKRKKVR
jgi:hypothetical protein